MTGKLRTMLMSSVCGALCFGAGDAAAQGTSSPGTIEELVVTAQKREESVMDVPLAVQAISGAALERQGTTTLNELIDFIPGASSVSHTAPGFETIQIRGIASGTTGDATTGYYIDDIPFGVPNLQIAPPVAMYDLQRIEVLRGPQGTLWGQGAMGGTIRLVTNAANPDTFSARAQAEGSNTSGGGKNYGLDAVVNVPIIAGKLGARVSAGASALSGFAESPDFPGEKNINDVKSRNVRGKLLFTPTEAVSVALTAWHVDNKMHFSNSLARVDPAVIAPTGRVRAYFDTKLDFYSGLATWDLGFGQLTSATGFLKYQLDFVSPTSILINDSTFDVKGFTEEVRLASNDDGNLHYLVGAYYNDSSIDSDIVLPILGRPFLDVSSTINTKTKALFGEVSYDLFDGRVTPLFGLRRFVDHRTVHGVDRITGLPRPSADETFKTTNPRFNLTVRPTDDGLIYVNVAKGFRSGTTQTPAQAAAAAIDGISTSTGINPDTVWSYELGAKFTALNGTLIFDTAIYHLRWQDMQLQFTTSAGVAALVNGGAAHGTGLDVGVIWRTPLEGLTLQAAGNMNNTRFHTVLPAVSKGIVGIKEGARVPSVPEGNITLAANYVFPLPRSGFEGFVNGSYVYRGDQIDTASGRRSDRINETGLRGGVQNDRWRLTVFADNLFDERAAHIRTATSVQGLYPRRIGIQVAFRTD